MPGKKTAPRKTEPIAIVGMGGVFPEARNLQEFWDNILSKKDCIRELPDSFDFDGDYKKDDYYDPDPFARDKTYANKAGYLPELEFDPATFGIPPKAMESISQVQLLALIVARDTLQDAGLLANGKNSLLRSRTGVVLGVAGFGDTSFQLAARLDHPHWRRVLENSGIPEPKAAEIIEKLKALYIEWNEDCFPGFLGNVVAGRITNRFDLGGINCTVDAACASSLGAIQMAVSELSEGNCDAVLTGGVQAENDVMSFMCFSKTRALSAKGICRPYDADSDGMLLGAGVGMMVLKRLEDAERDRDRIYAVIKGVGAASDGRANSIYAPHVSGQSAALRCCYEKAGILAGDIQLLEGHGTGTPAGDACEISSMLEFFAGVPPRSIALGSIKSQIGHLRAAAGAAGMIKVALSLYHQVLPPTLHIESPNPRLAAGDAPFYLNTEAKPWTRLEGESPRRGAVSAFGFGGSNFHIILEEYRSLNAALPRMDETGLQNCTTCQPIKKELPKITINGFRYLNPSSRERRDRALQKEAAESSQREPMKKPVLPPKDIEPQPGLTAAVLNDAIAARFKWQESLDRLQQRFHENQAGYIDLLTRHMEKQYTLIEKIPPGPHLEKVLDHFAATLRLFEENQQRYHDNHDRYLENQLRLLKSGSLSPDELPQAPAVRIRQECSDAPKGKLLPESSPERGAVQFTRQRIPLHFTTQDSDADFNPYASIGKVSPAPASVTPESIATDPADVSGIIEKLRDIVSDKTGYPKDILTMDMDLEADMGVDSIKRLEILGAMKEAFPDMPMELEGVGELRTLAEIASFLKRYLRNDAPDRIPGKEPPPAVPPVPFTCLPAAEKQRSPDSAGVSRVTGRLRSMILEKNGYPPETLTEDTDLDEVGLDIVQWLDIISAMQEEFPDLKVDINEMEHLKTLGQIERHLCGHLPGEAMGGLQPASPSSAPDPKVSHMEAILSDAPNPPEPLPNTPSPAAAFSLSRQVVISTASIEAEVDAAPKKQGPSLVKKKLDEPDRILSIFSENRRWVVMDEGRQVGRKLAGEIDRQGGKALLLTFPENLVDYGKQQAAETTEQVPLTGCTEKHCKAALDRIRKKYGPVCGFVYIHPFQSSAAASFTDLFRKEERMAACSAFWIAKHLRRSMPAKPDSDRLSFMAVSRMDGELGTSERKPFTLFGGCLSGLIRSLGREWPDVFCRFLDIAPEVSSGEAAAMIVKELADPRMDLVGVGYDLEGKRCTLEIAETEADPGRPDFLPNQKTVFLVSGGGRGITAECAIALAETFRSRFILLGRTEAAEDEPEWAREYPEEATLKEKIISRLRDQKERTTPVAAEKVLGPLLAGREVRNTLQRIEKNGGEAIYFAVDVTDSRSLHRVLEQARERFGEIDVLIHGAGNLADKIIAKKTVRDFERVFESKVLGLQNLLDCLDPDRLRSIVLFSSVTSLWGNAGQTDYAMANAFLDNFARCCRLLAPEKMVTAVNWGPWEHGMVTPSLQKIYRERHIDLIPGAVGSRMCVSLFQEKPEPQTVVCSRISIPLPAARKEIHAARVQRSLLYEANPFLQDHIIDGRPVLPATCAAHWMIQTCEALLPGHRFRELKEFKVLKGIVFEENGPKDYIVGIEPAAIELQKKLAVKIFSRNGKQPVHHYSAEIALSDPEIAEVMPIYAEMDITRDGRPPEEYYAGVPLFHGKSFQGVRQVCNIGPRHITVSGCLPPIDDANQGQFKAGSFNPYIADVHLQSILLWSGDFLKAGCLPASIDRIEQFHPIGFGEEFYVSTRIQSQAEYRLRVDMTVHDEEGKIHMRWTDVCLTVSERLHEQFRRNQRERLGDAETRRRGESDRS
jgi:3-oxoacyl-(acyl-carrier-protein) synthase/NAD(P)-dependent dehydrogenase (short-subunit alcohol dehydrogenase family)/acyl carrier protein